MPTRERTFQAVLPARPAMLIGYARVSTRRQRLDLQHRALEAARCDLIISEWRSGDSGIGHGLGAAMECCGAGDLLVVWKLDRLGRNVMELMGVIERLRRRGAGLVSRFILRISATR